MDAMIGRYAARVEENGLLLRHASGTIFDLTVEEAVSLLDLLNAYRQTLLTLQHLDAEPQTDPRIPAVVVKKD